MNAEYPELGHLIDRLIDDELDAAARRALFAQLDAEPGAWRRCALAFLEQQSWRSALLVSPGEASEECTRVPARRRTPLVLVAMAAGLFAAFALGWSVRGGTPPSGPLVASTQGASIKVTHEGSDALAPSTQEHGESDDAPLSVTTTVPYAETPPHALLGPETVLRLQRCGYEVEPQQRRLIALTLENGRRVTVPVEEVRFHYVGNPTF